jgi:hypothetical protein
MNRREFLLQTGAATGLAASSLLARAQSSPIPGQGVSLVCDPADRIAAGAAPQWALVQLRAALTQRGFIVHACTRLDQAPAGDFCVIAAGRASSYARDAGAIPPATTEGLAITPARLGGRDVVVASGNEGRGLAYALNELADAVTLTENPGAVLRPVQPVIERPANLTRSLMRCFSSDVEDKGWYHDRDFWKRYLSLLAAQRFNRFNLAFGLGYDAPNRLKDTYLYFAYPFLLDVPGYKVRATNLPDAERDRNLEMLRFISDESAARGMHFRLGLWTHAYQWTNSPDANHNIEGLTPQTHAAYSRDALALLLKECPNIWGVTFRIHGESGVPEGSYDFWRAVFDGCRHCGRTIEIDMHAKGMDQQTIDIALGTGLPVSISPKFWAEHLGLPYHQAAIRPNELPKRAKGTGAFAQSEGARSFLRYGYGDLLKSDRRYHVMHRIWPGTQKLLLWGDPVFASGYGRAMHIAGTSGCELFDPLSFKGREGSGLPGSRDGYADASLRPAGGDFEKYRYTYRLWGRMLFNPETPPEVWQRQLRGDYGLAAEGVEAALGPASRVLPLLTTAHLPSASNNNFWPEMYTNMALRHEPERPYNDTPLPRRFGTVSPLDPQLFSRIDDYARELLQGAVGAKYSPLEVAQWLGDLAETAAIGLKEADAKAVNPADPAFRRMAVDVQVQIGLGRFFSQKLRAGIFSAIHELNFAAGAAARPAAIAAYRAARATWAEIVAATASAYVADISFGDSAYKRGNWSDRLAEIDADLAALATPPSPDTLSERAIIPVDPERMAAVLALVAGRLPERRRDGIHVPSAAFRPGQPLPVSLAASATNAMLHYRHAMQAESWQSLPLAMEAGSFQGAIPAAYTASPYPLEYYFELADGSNRWLAPGFAPSLDNQPYFLVLAEGAVTG